MKQMAESMDHSEFDDLKLSRDEANRLKAAFKDKEFVKLFQDYVEDVTSPEGKKSYEEDVISIEKARGFDVKFLHPIPCYVMKFQSGTKYFVNICKNEYVKEPTYERKKEGTQWKIPTILSKPREDLDKKKAKCTVVDVMFHPNTIDLATKNRRIKSVVEDTAVSTVEEKFGISLKDQRPAYPKMKYKGKPPSVVLRNNGQTESVCNPMEDYVKELMELKDESETGRQKNDGRTNQNDDGHKKNDTGKSGGSQQGITSKNARSDDNTSDSSDQNDDGNEKNGTRKSVDTPEGITSKNAHSDENSSDFSALDQKTNDSHKKEQATDQPSFPKAVAPKYSLKYRNIVDLQDYSLMGYTDKTAPKEIVVEIQLPRVSRASEVELEVSERKLMLWSGPDAPHKYDLEVELSYAVNSNSGSAKFDKTKKVLNVTLPVKERPPLSNVEFANGA